MKNGSKIIITIVAIVLFMAVFGAIVGVRGDAGSSTPGILGLVVGFGFIGAMRAVWKKDKDDV